MPGGPASPASVHHNNFDPANPLLCIENNPSVPRNCTITRPPPITRSHTRSNNCYCWQRIALWFSQYSNTFSFLYFSKDCEKICEISLTALLTVSTVCFILWNILSTLQRTKYIFRNVRNRNVLTLLQHISGLASPRWC